MLERPVDADRVVGMQPREHAGDERRVVLAAEAVEVKPPLGDGGLLAGELGQPGEPVEAAGLGEDLPPPRVVVQLAVRGVGVGAVGAAVPVVDVGAHQVHVGGTGPRVDGRGGARVDGPQEPEVLSGHRPHGIHGVPPGQDVAVRLGARASPLAPVVPGAGHLPAEVDDRAGEAVFHEQRAERAEPGVIRAGGGSLQRRAGLLPVHAGGVRGSLPQQRGKRGRDGA